MPAPADNGVRAEVAGVRIRDVHRAALALAIAGFLAQQLREHAVGRRALGQAMAVAAVRAGDVVVAAEDFADAAGDGYLADIKMGKAGHQRTGIKIVDPLLEQADGHHLPVHVQQPIDADPVCDVHLLLRGHTHC
jgi:hypothetical protein